MPAPSNPELVAFLSDAMRRVPGFSPETVQIEAGAALRDFCTRSTAWRVTTPADLLTGATDVTFTISETGATPILLLRATDDGSDQMLAGSMPPYGSDLLLSGPARGRPQRAILLSPFTVRVYPRADSDYALTLELAITANNAEAAVPEGFWVQHHEALMHGLLARLHSMPGTPASSEKLSVFYHKHFRAACASARAAADRGFHQAFAPALPYPRPPGARRMR